MFSVIQYIVKEFQLNAKADFVEALSVLVRRIRIQMKVNVCNIYLLNPESQEYVLMATKGLKSSSVRKISLKKKEGLVGRVADRGELINEERPENNPFFRFFPQTGEAKYHSFMGAPIMHHGETLGVLVVQHRATKRFKTDEESFLQTIAILLSDPIQQRSNAGELELYTRQDWRGNKIRTFRGLSGSPGLVIGTVVGFKDEVEFGGALETATTPIRVEKEIFSIAIEKTLYSIKQEQKTLLNKLTDQERMLYSAYAQMLDDNNMGGEVSKLLEQGYTALSSWKFVVNKHCQAFGTMTDSYIKERGSDIRDLGNRVLENMAGSFTEEVEQNFPDSTIIVAEEVTSLLLSKVPREKLAGIISIKGSHNSHLCILARAMDIPTVVGIDGLNLDWMQGQRVILDGNKGYIYLNSPKWLLKQYTTQIGKDKDKAKTLEELKDRPSVTADGHKISLQINTGLLVDKPITIQDSIEGVGLYRSEVPFLSHEYLPTEDEQEIFYRQQLTQFSPKPVTIRTLDVGGDKPLASITLNEANPFLGWRGIRICLDHPEIFLVQLRSLLKASEGLNNLRVMFPMIASIEELDLALKFLKQAYQELKEEENRDIVFPLVGVMIEVPSAVFLIEEITRKVDFISIGSNDLIQYMLAVDRNNARVVRLYQPLHPAILAALNHVAKASLKSGKALGICGEMAGEPKAIVILVGMGFEYLSMNISRLTLAKKVITSIEKKQAEILVKHALTLSSSDEVERCIDEYIATIEPLKNILTVNYVEND